jgi:hypothetical protein
VEVVLISTYDLGRQPFGLASPAAFLRAAGHTVHCVDLTRTKLDDDLLRGAALVAFYLPMHTATRLALPVMDRVRAVNPAAHVCAYGLYAPLNAAVLREHGAHTVLGPEFEADLVRVAGDAGLKACATAADASLKACATAADASLKACATAADASLKAGATAGDASLKAGATAGDASQAGATTPEQLADVAQGFSPASI